MYFRNPIAGVMICLTDEKIAAGKNVVHCEIEAPEDHKVTVNGISCTYIDGCWRVDVPLDAKRLELVARDETTGEQAHSHVWRLYTPKKVYRLSIDDGVWFLQDIAKNQDRYQSIFENPYLALLRRLHEEYGTKFHINIYYTCPEHGGFSLPELSDCFKAEWQSVNDWMTLSFHAKANNPGYPYSNADRKTVFEDCKAVMDEIERFVGYRGAVTTLHFAETSAEGVRGLYDCGVRALLGDFSFNKNGEIQLCYFASREQFDAVRNYCFWKNPETDMIMFPCDTVLNCMPPEEIRKEMAWFDEQYPDRSFVDILIHEQYFYEDYKVKDRSYYLPDYEARMRAGIEWCIEHGYVPGLVKDIIDFNDPDLVTPR
ncbi:MAG: hypothetical protein E7637_00680 [Ruminococcaceae bacterium]|nr:hypothetical protein [Oscillospiraceae bacterium]